MSRLKKDNIEKAFDALIDEQVARSEKEAPVIDKEYITICAEFIFSAFNIGLPQACIYFENSSSTKKKELQKARFCKAILAYLGGAEDYDTLYEYVVHSDREIAVLHVQITDAIDYLKLALQACKH